MNWRKIVDAFKRLDDRLSDAVYLHGCYLTGQEKIVFHRQGEARNHSPEDSNASAVHVSGKSRFDGRQDVRRGFAIH